MKPTLESLAREWFGNHGWNITLGGTLQFHGFKHRLFRCDVRLVKNFYVTWTHKEDEVKDAWEQLNDLFESHNERRI